MYAEREIGSLPYRAGLNPAFVRRVMEKRRHEAAIAAQQQAMAEREAKRIAALKKAEERKEERERVRLAQEDAARTIEAARADVGQVVVYRLDDHQHTYAAIEARALRLFKMTKSELHSKRRNLEVVFARQFIMYWASRLTQHSQPLIGKLMGGRDHTTVLHGKRVYVAKRASMGRNLRTVR